MKMAIKQCLGLTLLFVVLSPAVWAGQQIYLSESPNGSYRVLVEQQIDRRIGDQIFFRYPITVENIRHTQHHFQMTDATTPLIQESLKGTFQIHWESAKFDWSKDSLKFFLNLEVIEGIWKTYFVDIDSGKTTDITADLEQPMTAKIESRHWDCQAPQITLLKWVKPHLAFFQLTSVCGKNKEKSNESFFSWNESVLFDTIQGKAVMGLDNTYSEEAATKKFEQYYISSMPTPTPTVEETPVAQ